MMRQSSGPYRVLQVTSKMFQGGAETFIMNAYRQIDRSLVQFDFLVFHEQEEHYEKEIRDLGGRIFRIPVMDSKRFHSFRSDLDAFFSQHSDEFAVVHGHMAALGMAYFASAKRAGIATRIAHSHTAGFDRTVRGIVKHCLNSSFSNDASCCVACSDLAGKYMFRQRDYIVLNNGIDVSQFRYSDEARSAIRNELSIPGDAYVVGHVGRFEIEKNQRFLIEMMPLLENDNVKIYLLLVGEGSTKSELEALSVRLGVSERIKFTGCRNDMGALYSAMDIFVMPSHYEGLPFTAVEAQSSGLPCLLSTGISKEARLTDDTFYLDLSLPLKKWAETTIEILERSHVDRLAAGDYVRSAGYDIATTTEQLMNIYQSGWEKL